MNTSAIRSAIIAQRRYRARAPRGSGHTCVCSKAPERVKEEKTKGQGVVPVPVKRKAASESVGPLAKRMALGPDPWSKGCRRDCLVQVCVAASFRIVGKKPTHQTPFTIDTPCTVLACIELY